MSRYKMEELIPIVARLTEKYTCKESSSITYQKARQLMEAVFYCIHELDDTHILGASNKIVSKKLDAETAYALGFDLVTEKVSKARMLFEQISEDFCAYNNICYYETVVKGMPAFFIHYDLKFKPQDHLLTLDYPTIQTVYHLNGVDAIYQYLIYIQLEQLFLKAFPEKVILELLTRYHKAYAELIINIPGIVLKHILAGMVIGKGSDLFTINANDYENLQHFALSMNHDQLRERLEKMIGLLIQKVYKGDPALYDYLKEMAKDFSVEWMNAAENNCLNAIF